MFNSLLTIAKNNGITGFTAEVLRENKAMQVLFQRSGLKVESSIEDGVYSFIMEF